MQLHGGGDRARLGALNLFPNHCAAPCGPQKVSQGRNTVVRPHRLQCPAWLCSEPCSRCLDPSRPARVLSATAYRNTRAAAQAADPFTSE